MKHSFVSFAYYALLPCCFVYYISTSVGLIAPVLGGYFSIVATVLVMPLVVVNFLLFNKVNRQSFAYDVLFYIFIIYYLIVVGFNITFNNSTGQHLIDHIATIVYMLCFYVIFKNVNLQSKFFYRVNLVFLLFVCVVVFYFTSNSVFILTINGIGLVKNEVSYQFIALILMLSISIVLSKNPRLLYRIILYMFLIPVLYFNGARSEFLAFLIVIPIMEFFLANRPLLSALVSGCVVVIIVVGLWMFRDILSSSNRVVDLLVNTTQGGGVVSRITLTDNALQLLAGKPFFGAFGEYEPGSYAHNIISVWVDLGLPGFMLYSLLLFIPSASVLYLLKIRKAKAGILSSIVFMCCVSIILLLFAKSHIYLFPIACFGLFSNYLNNFNVSLNIELF